MSSVKWKEFNRILRYEALQNLALNYKAGRVGFVTVVKQCHYLISLESLSAINQSVNQPKSTAIESLSNAFND